MNNEVNGPELGSGLISSNPNKMLPNKLLSSKKDSVGSKASPNYKRPNPNSKVLGDFAMNKLNSAFEDF